MCIRVTDFHYRDNLKEGIMPKAKKVVKKASKDIVIMVTMPKSELKDAIENGDVNHVIAHYVNEARDLMLKVVDKMVK